jgi:FtsP/CotA-like multicopper oxidase with cupredoxin domain
MFRTVEGGGESITYEYRIPVDHAPGIHWYHSHVHGVSALHLMGGLVGAVIVQPFNLATDIPLSMGLMSRQVLVLSHFMADTTENLVGGTAQDEAFDSSLSYTRLSAMAGSTLPLLPSYTNPVTRDAWFTNGQYQPTRTILPGQWLIFDILVASGDRMIELELTSSSSFNTSLPSSCTAFVLALDGVYLTARRSLARLPLLPGARASIAVMCAVRGTYYFRSTSTVDPQDPLFSIGTFETKSIQPLLIIQVSGPPANPVMQAPPSDLTSIKRPPYLTSLQYSAPATSGRGSVSDIQTWSLGYEQHGAMLGLVGSDYFWIGEGMDCTLPCFSDVYCNALFGSNFTANELPSVVQGLCTYESFRLPNGTSSSAIVVVANVVQQISIWGRQPTAYTFHLEGTHFQVVSYESDTGVDTSYLYGELGDWRDVWPSMVGKTVVRTVFSDFSGGGSRLVQSNNLKYEDYGMLTALRVSSPLAGTPSDSGSSPTAAPISPPVQSRDEFTADNTTTPHNPENPDSVPRIDLCDPYGGSYFYSETVDYVNRVRIINTSSCPNHFSVCQSDECSGGMVTRAIISNITVKIPLYPVISESFIDTTCTSSEAVGIALNGVRIAGPSDGHTSVCGSPNVYGQPSSGRSRCNIFGTGDGTQYCGDAVVQYGKTFDVCGGHADELGNYHYHSTPNCLIAQLSPNDTRITSSTNSPQIGWSLDGFPIFGPLGPKGIIMARCGHASADPSICLDACNGYFGEMPGFDLYLYRYFMAGEMPSLPAQCSGYVNNSGTCLRDTDPCCPSTVPSKQYFPYSVGCYRGCPIGVASCTPSGLRGTTANFIPPILSPLSGVYTSPPSSSSPPSLLPTTPITQRPSAGNESYYYKAQAAALKKRQQQPVPQRTKVAVRDTFSRAISIISFDNGSTQALPSGNNDAYISGVVLDPLDSTM